MSHEEFERHKASIHGNVGNKAGGMIAAFAQAVDADAALRAFRPVIQVGAAALARIDRAESEVGLESEVAPIARQRATSALAPAGRWPTASIHEKFGGPQGAIANEEVRDAVPIASHQVRRRGREGDEAAIARYRQQGRRCVRDLRARWEMEARELVGFEIQAEDWGLFGRPPGSEIGGRGLKHDGMAVSGDQAERAGAIGDAAAGGFGQHHRRPAQAVAQEQIRFVIGVATYETDGLKVGGAEHDIATVGRNAAAADRMIAGGLAIVADGNEL